MNTEPAAETRPEIPRPSSCCGGPAPEPERACCALDAEVKSTGGEGCGCTPKSTEPTKACCG